MPYTVSDGCVIHYRVTGEGPPLLLIPGWGATLHDFDALVSRLRRRFTCIAIDQRGTGESGHPEELWTMDTLAADAVAVLDAVGVHRAHVLGDSLGGMVAQELAHHHPDRLQSLILLSTSPGLISWPPRARLLLTLGESLERMERQDAATDRPPDRVRELLTIPTYLGVLELRSVRTPALILHGTEDLLIPPANARLLHRLLRNSTVHWLRGVDHRSLQLALPVIAAAVIDFTRGLSTAPGHPRAVAGLA